MPITTEALIDNIVNRKDWNPGSLLEQLYLFREQLIRYMELFDIRTMNEVMNVISICLKQENDIPSLSLLQVSLDFLYIIRTEMDVVPGEKFLENDWPINFRIVIRRLLQTRAIVYGEVSTSHQDVDQYLPVLFELSVEMISLIGYRWFESDPDFMLLLASLSSVRLQYFFNAEIEIEEAFMHGCFHYFFLRFGELPDFLSDEKATTLSIILRESAALICKNYQIFHRNIESYEKERVNPVYEFLCAYINSDGLATLPSECTKNLGVVLLDLALSCEQPMRALECFADVIPHLPDLPNTTTGTIVEFLKTKNSNNDSKETAVRILKSLTKQTDSKISAATHCWYTTASVSEAKTFLEQLKADLSSQAESDAERVSRVVNHSDEDNHFSGSKILKNGV